MESIDEAGGCGTFYDGKSPTDLKILRGVGGGRAVELWGSASEGERG